jgi:hypothetical protein
MAATSRIVASTVAAWLGMLPGPAPFAQRPTAARPSSTYWVYVGAESADLIQRIRFGPEGTTVEKTTTIGELPTEMEGPHGLAITPDGKYLRELRLRKCCDRSVGPAMNVAGPPPRDSNDAEYEPTARRLLYSLIPQRAAISAGLQHASESGQWLASNMTPG